MMRKGLALFGFCAGFTPGAGRSGASLERGLSLGFLSLVVPGGRASGTVGTGGPPLVGGDCAALSTGF